MLREFFYYNINRNYHKKYLTKESTNQSILHYIEIYFPNLKIILKTSQKTTAQIVTMLLSVK